MPWLKQNWFRMGILLFLGLVVIFYFLWRSPKENNDLAQQDASSVANNLKFDIDLEKLAYPLPLATKVCIPTSKEYCPGGTSCSPMKPAVFLLIDEVQNKYYRCDNKPCDGYDYSSNVSGIYSVIHPLPPKHGEIKLSNDGTYYETVSLGLDLYISSGICKNIQ